MTMLDMTVFHMERSWNLFDSDFVSMASRNSEKISILRNTLCPAQPSGPVSLKRLRLCLQGTKEVTNQAHACRSWVISKVGMNARNYRALLAARGIISGGGIASRRVSVHG